MADALSRVGLERLASVLAYEPETGLLSWTPTAGTRLLGRPVGTTDHKGYRLVTVDGVVMKAHRVAWALFHGRLPVLEIDHVNGARADNRIANLRQVSTATNRENRRAADADSAVPLLGVSKSGSRYRATIRTQGKQTHLGTFLTPEEAHAAYVAAKRDLHPGCTL